MSPSQMWMNIGLLALVAASFTHGAPVSINKQQLKQNILEQTDKAEDELSKLLREVEESAKPKDATNELEKDPNTKTSLLIQKTKIVIPYEEDKNGEKTLKPEAAVETEVQQAPVNTPAEAPADSGKEPIQPAPMPDQPTDKAADELAQQLEAQPSPLLAQQPPMPQNTQALFQQDQPLIQEEQMLEPEPQQPQQPSLEAFLPPQAILPQFAQPQPQQFLYPSDYQLEDEQVQEAPIVDGFPTYDETSAEMSEVDLSPPAVAEYLMLTGDFAGFEEVIAELLSKGLLSMDQVEQYKDMVGAEYERLMAAVSQIQEQYLQSTYNRPETYFPGGDYPAYERQNLPESLPLAVGGGDVDLGAEMKRMELAAALENEDDLNRLLEALVKEYLDNAQQKGENLEPGSQQDYENFVNWMEQSLADEEQQQEQQQPQEEQKHEQEIEEELNELLPNDVQQEQKEEEASGDLEMPMDIFPPSGKDTSEKKLKKNLEAKQ